MWGFGGRGSTNKLSYGLVPILVPLTTLVAQVGIAIVKVPYAGEVVAISGSLRLLTSGTHTVVIKNGSNTLGTLTWVAAGVQTSAITNANVAAGDNLNFDITALGTVPVDNTITVWLKIPLVA